MTALKRSTCKFIQQAFGGNSNLEVRCGCVGRLKFVGMQDDRFDRHSCLLSPCGVHNYEASSHEPHVPLRQKSRACEACWSFQLQDIWIIAKYADKITQLSSRDSIIWCNELVVDVHEDPSAFHRGNPEQSLIRIHSVIIRYDVLLSYFYQACKHN